MWLVSPRLIFFPFLYLCCFCCNDWGSYKSLPRVHTLNVGLTGCHCSDMCILASDHTFGSWCWYLDILQLKCLHIPFYVLEIIHNVTNTRDISTCGQHYGVKLILWSRCFDTELFQGPLKLMFCFNRDQTRQCSETTSISFKCVYRNVWD